MRTIIIAIISLAILMNVKASEMTATCEGLEILGGGIDSFKHIENYFPMHLKISDGEKIELFTEEGSSIRGQLIAYGTKDDEIRVNFGQGDQDSIFTFKKNDFNEFMSGRISNIFGFYEDGFWWTNGYNVRAKFTTKCTIDQLKFLDQ